MSDPAPIASTRPARTLDVDIVHEAGEWDAFAGTEDLIHAAARALAASPDVDLGKAAAATIALADDALVKDLNKRFRGQDKSTNVLSFPAPQSDDNSLGDIVFALETIEREAVDLGIPAAHHLQHLTVHGLLHLLGFDHMTDDDAEEMEALETRILASLGVPDPYAGSDPLPP